jgi:glycosyltransferase involved in cell wall biosynthesis
MRSRRILLVVTQLEPGGAQRMAMNMAAWWRARGTDARVVFLYTKEPCWGEVEYCASLFGRSPQNLLDGLLIFSRLYREWKRYNPSHVVGFTYYANLMAAFLRLLLPAVRVIATQHTEPSRYPRVPKWLDKAVGTSGLYTENVAVSKAVSLGFGSYPAGFRRRLRTIRNGHQFDASRLEPRAARRLLGLPEEGFLVGNVGRLAEQKNQKFLIEVLTAAPTVQAAFAGEGPLRAELQSFAEELGVTNRVHFLGVLDRNQIGHFYAAIDVFGFPSLFEGLSLALVEAILAGTAIVASDIAENVDPLGRRAVGSGLLPLEVSTWARELERLATDEDYRGQRKEYSKRRAGEFNFDEMMQKYDSLASHARK